MTAADYDTKSDTAFFTDITEVFRRHPEAAKKYALASLALERELGVDSTRQCGVSWIEGDRIITEFRDRDTEPEVILAQLCIKYELVGQDLVCVHRIETPV